MFTSKTVEIAIVTLLVIAAAVVIYTKLVPLVRPMLDATTKPAVTRQISL